MCFSRFGMVVQKVHEDITVAGSSMRMMLRCIPTIFVETVLLRKHKGCTLYNHSYATASYYDNLVCVLFAHHHPYSFIFFTCNNYHTDYVLKSV